MRAFQQSDFYTYFITAEGEIKLYYSEEFANTISIDINTLNSALLDTRLKGATVAWFLADRFDAERLLSEHQHLLSFCNLEAAPEGDTRTVLWMLSNRNMSLLIANPELLKNANLDATSNTGPFKGETILWRLAMSSSGKRFLLNNPDLLKKWNLYAYPDDNKKTVLELLLNDYEGICFFEKNPKLLENKSSLSLIQFKKSLKVLRLFESLPDSKDLISKSEIAQHFSNSLEKGDIYLLNILIYVREIKKSFNKNPSVLLENCDFDTPMRDRNGDIIPFIHWMFRDFFSPLEITPLLKDFLLKIVAEKHPELVFLNSFILRYPIEMFELFEFQYRLYDSNETELLRRFLFVFDVKFDDLTVIQAIGLRPCCQELIRVLSPEPELKKLLSVLALIGGKSGAEEVDFLRASLEAKVEIWAIPELPAEIKLAIITSSFFDEHPEYSFLEPIFDSIRDRAINNYRSKKEANIEQFVITSFRHYFGDDQVFVCFQNQPQNKNLIGTIVYQLTNYVLSHRVDLTQKEGTFIEVLLSKAKQDFKRLSYYRIEAGIYDCFGPVRAKPQLAQPSLGPQNRLFHKPQKRRFVQEGEDSPPWKKAKQEEPSVDLRQSI